jgi:hypothetical protein
LPIIHFSPLVLAIRFWPLCSCCLIPCRRANRRACKSERASAKATLLLNIAIPDRHAHNLSSSLSNRLFHPLNILFLRFRPLTDPKDETIYHYYTRGVLLSQSKLQTPSRTETALCPPPHTRETTAISPLHLLG